MAEGVGVAAGVDVAGTLVGDGVAVADGCTVRCGAGVGVADVVALARGVGRDLAGDRGGLGVGEAAGRTVAWVPPGSAFGGGIIA